MSERMSGTPHSGARNGNALVELDPDAWSLRTDLGGLLIGTGAFSTPHAPSGPSLSVLLPFTPTDSEMREHLLDVDSELGMGVAEAFAERAQAKKGVAEVWATQEGAATTVTVITTDFDLDRDLELQAAFSAAVRDLTPGRECVLDIFAVSEGVPADIRNGRRL